MGLKLFGKYICNIACTRDVRDGNFLELLCLPDCIFMDIEMAHTLCAERMRPFHCTAIVVINGSGVAGRKIEISKDVSKHLDVLYTFVGSLYLSLT